MNIKEAKEEIKHTLLAYNRKDAAGRYTFPKLRQRPVLLMGPPGIGKTAIMEQVAEECNVGLVAYTITHHTRQSAVGLPPYHIVDCTVSGIDLVKNGVSPFRGLFRSNAVVPDPVCRIGVI